MSLVSLLYANTSIAIQPFDNENPNRRMFMDDVAEQIVWWDDVLGVELFRIGGSGGISVGFHPVTYAQLTALIGANSLEKGDFYLITDFATRHIIPNTAVVNTGVVEPIFMQASSVNTLNQNAISTLFPLDIISYEVVDSTTAGGNKGRIYYRRDTIKNNSTYYDWRNVKFRRWETAPASGIFTVITDNGGAFQDFYTFNNSAIATGCDANTLGEITDFGISILGAPTDRLSNFVINIPASNNNIFGNDCFQNTITGIDICWNNRISTGFYLNTIGDDFIDNTIGVLFFSNTIGDGCFDNVIGQNTQLNDIGTSFSGNRIGDNFQANTIGNSFSNNFINGTFQSNTIGNSFQDNQLLGNGFSNNTIGNSFTVNVIGAGFGSNTIANSFGRNQIGTNFTSNAPIGDLFANNVIGNQFASNTNINASFQKNHIEADLNGQNFLGATHVYNNYTKNIFKRTDLTYQLSYIDGANTILYAVPTA